MVSRRFTQGLSWLHARVGRRVKRISESNQRVTNSHARVDALTVAPLSPTVYLPSLRDKKLVA
ncbi:MAG TPA: hypothetical protein VHH32_01580 [Gemmatimonadales bacterium]|nr:hypothetical protein [Gemmatimonadales bacterium]